MSKADEMFDELGYHKLSENFYEKGDYNISFEIKQKTLTKEKYNPCTNSYNAVPITMRELQAINEKSKELGWEE